MNAWSEDQDAILRRDYAAMGVSTMAAALGRTCAAVRNRAYTLGITAPNPWTDGDREILRAAYTYAGAGKIDLGPLAATLGRSKPEVCRIARQMGLSNQLRMKTENGPADRRKFGGDAAALSAHLSNCAKDRIANNGHPRGMAGKSHTPETRQTISRMSAKMWRDMTPKQRVAAVQKMVDGRQAVGFSPPEVKRGSWKAGWREIGDKRIYFRSRWEANYAHFLEWLCLNGEIAAWDYEPKTFWFEAIRRGVRSYKPDFLVTENSGASAWHEVKGWMDSRSRTTLRRMAKYYPQERVIVIAEKQYRAIRLKALGLVPGWEDSARDARS